MKISVEASGLKIGVDNAITEAITTGNWGVRLTFTNDKNDGRSEHVISTQECESLIFKIENVLSSIRELKKQMDKKEQ